jgi:TonB family protein
MIFLNQKHHSSNDLEQIKAHELVHVRQYHSVDALLIHLAIIFQWFNPFVWLLKYSIYENHEFIADRETSCEATNYKYHDLMLKQAAGIPLSTLVHPFNKLSLKRRFKMLLKNQSNKRNLLKYLLLVPVAGALFWSLSCENKGDNSLSGNDDDWGEEVVSSIMDNQKGKELVAFMSEESKNGMYFMNVKSEDVYTQQEKGPSFKGPGNFHEYLNKKIHYPEEAKVNNISGIVYAYFEIDRKGKVQNAKIIDGISESFDKEVLEAVKNMPDWEPAYFMGKPLVMQLVVPISFSQITTGDDAKKFIQRVGLPSELVNDEVKNTGEKQKPFVVVDKPPQFPGGEEGRMQYLTDNIDYPKQARDEGIQGTVYVTFIVEADGSITNVKVLRGIGGGCDEEAVEVVEKMPDWEPGKKDGEAVRTQFNMPIRFTLNSDD